jgi:hypothetical protein
VQQLIRDALKELPSVKGNPRERDMLDSIRKYRFLTHPPTHPPGLRVIGRGSSLARS